MAGNYTNPEWHNSTSPALNETNLNAISDGIEQNQTDIATLQSLTANYSTVSGYAAQVPTLAARTICVSNVSLASTAWAADSTYSTAGYAYRAKINVTGVTTSYVPIVSFGMSDALSQNFAPVAVCTNGGVYIYAVEKPTATMTIASVVCIATTA